MFLVRTFDDPQLNLTLEVFLRVLRDFLGERLVSVILYGSAVSGDLAPGYGDLDFVAAVEGNLSEEDCRGLREIRRPLRGGGYGILAAMLEGAFLPRAMLDPGASGRAFWWGTNGERTWRRNELGWFVLHILRQQGAVIWGDDIRPAIPAAKDEDLAACLADTCRAMKERARPGELRSIDWLLTAARMLLWLIEGRLSSKSEAAEWAARHAKGAWRELLPRASELRMNPAAAEAPVARRWLETLSGPIREAADEVQRELEGRI